MRNLILTLVLLTSACDREGADMLPDAVGGHPIVLEMGSLGVMSASQLAAFQASEDPYAWCQENLDAQGNPLCSYGQLGPPETGKRGGATYTFDVPATVQEEGVEEATEVTNLCIIVDPETVFWNAAISVEDREDKYAFPDFPDDDGDLDLFAGMSAYYTGSPGVELGDFKGYYTDSLGRTIEIEYGECFQSGAQLGFNTAHSGRAAVEFCDFEVEGRAGTQFTVVLDTFSVPLNDGAMAFGTMVVAEECRRLDVNECTIRGESLEPLESNPVARTCTPQLELASCAEKLQEFCCLHPSMCWDEKAPDDACDSFNAVYDPAGTGDAWDNFCNETADDGTKPNEVYCCEEARG
jgi:hypothetical protein